MSKLSPLSKFKKRDKDLNEINEQLNNLDINQNQETENKIIHLNSNNSDEDNSCVITNDLLKLNQQFIKNNASDLDSQSKNSLNESRNFVRKSKFRNNSQDIEKLNSSLSIHDSEFGIKSKYNSQNLIVDKSTKSKFYNENFSNEFENEVKDLDNKNQKHDDSLLKNFYEDLEYAKNDKIQNEKSQNLYTFYNNSKFYIGNFNNLDQASNQEIPNNYSDKNFISNQIYNKFNEIQPNLIQNQISQSHIQNIGYQLPEGYDRFNLVSPPQINTFNQTMTPLINQSQLSYQYFSSVCYKTLIMQTKEQAGCRKIQKMLEDAPELGSKILYGKLKPGLNEIMLDQFGNYLIQKLLETLSLDQITETVNLVCQDIKFLSNNQYGTRVLQKLIDYLESKENRDKFISYFNSEILLSIILNNQGNHVISKLISKYPPDELVPFHNTFETNIEQITKDKFGCCVIQKMIEKCKSEFREVLIKKLMTNVGKYIHDAYANYVLQLSVSYNHKKYNNEILLYVYDNFMFYALEKFSSNVIVKTLSFTDEEVREKIVSLIENNELIIQKLLLDLYGNHILQKVLIFSSDKGKEKILAVVYDNLDNLEKVSHGNKLKIRLFLTYNSLSSKISNFNPNPLKTKKVKGIDIKNDFINNLEPYPKDFQNNFQKNYLYPNVNNQLSSNINNYQQNQIPYNNNSNYYYGGGYDQMYNQNFIYPNIQQGIINPQMTSYGSDLHYQNNQNSNFSNNPQNYMMGQVNQVNPYYNYQPSINNMNINYLGDKINRNSVPENFIYQNVLNNNIQQNYSNNSNNFIQGNNSNFQAPNYSNPTNSYTNNSSTYGPNSQNIYNNMDYFYNQ